WAAEPRNSLESQTRANWDAFTDSCAEPFYGSLGPLWAIPTEEFAATRSRLCSWTRQRDRQSGGHFGPVAVGALRERFGDFRIAFVALSVSLALAGTLALLLKSGCSMVSAHVSDNRRGGL